MRLNAKILKNVVNVNQWEYTNQAHVQEGQINEIYLQLVDLDKSMGTDKSLIYPEFPMRFLPQGTVVQLSVTFPALRSQVTSPVTAEEFTVIATQPFTGDLSIFKLALTSSQLPKGGSIKAKLTVDSVDSFFLVTSAVSVSLINVGGA